MEFYNLNINTPGGQLINLSEFKDQVILIVNTATKCKLASQFDELEILHQKFKDQGLVVLGFPCDQFGNQEPETNDSMESVCRINHGVSFQLTEKIDVNGPETHPVFKYLKNEKSSLFGKRIKWNFTKFLVDRNGTVTKRYASFTSPVRVQKDIIKLLR